VRCSSSGSSSARRQSACSTTTTGGPRDAVGRTLRSFDDREIPYDFLVSIPTHGGAAFVEASGLGSELGFMPTHPNSLRAKADDHIFVVAMRPTCRARKPILANGRADERH
jgi:hypothetical protein